MYYAQKSSVFIILFILPNAAFSADSIYPEMTPARQMAKTPMDQQPIFTFHPEEKPPEPSDPGLKEKKEVAVLAPSEQYDKQVKERQNEIQLANRLYVPRKKARAAIAEADHLNEVQKKLAELNAKVYEASLIGGPVYHDALRERDAFFASQTSQ